MDCCQDSLPKDLRLRAFSLPPKRVSRQVEHRMIIEVNTFSWYIHFEFWSGLEEFQDSCHPLGSGMEITRVLKYDFIVKSEQWYYHLESAVEKQKLQDRLALYLPIKITWPVTAHLIWVSWYWIALYLPYLKLIANTANDTWRIKLHLQEY